MVAIVTTAATENVVVLNLCTSSCNVCCFCSILTKICVCREIPVKITNINFQTNVFELFHEDRQKGETMEGRRVVTKLIDACLQLPYKKRNKNLILILYK
jgi:hypothetical protein